MAQRNKLYEALYTKAIVGRSGFGLFMGFMTTVKNIE